MSAPDPIAMVSGASYERKTVVLGNARKCRALTVGTVWLIALLSAGESRSDDTQIWLRAGVRQAFRQRWRLDFEQRVRLSAVPLEVDSVLPELALNLDLARWLVLTGGYRYTEQRNAQDAFVSFHRLYADAVARLSWKSLRIENRLRLQEDMTWESSERNQHRARNRVQVAWKTERFVEPYASAEVFLKVADEGETGWQRYRLEAGLEFPVGPHSPAVGYRLQDPLNDPEAAVTHIILVRYDYNL